SHGGLIRAPRLGALIAALLAATSAGCAHVAPSIVVGRVRATPLVAPVQPGPTEAPVPPEIVPPPRLASADSHGPASEVAFAGAVDVPADLLFFLVVGSDARPGEDVRRSRADSIHIVAVDPQTRRGTVLGLPRDSYVDIPGHGRQKINAALAL